jgi:hypothetical protein
MGQEPSASAPRQGQAGLQACPPEGRPALVLPHRGTAIVVFTLIAVGAFGLSVLAWLLRWGVVRGQSDEGTLLHVVGLLAFLGYMGLGLVVWAMAAGDLRLMSDGRMDAAGMRQTRLGKLIAMLLVMAAVVVGLAAAILSLTGMADIRLTAPQVSG